MKLEGVLVCKDYADFLAHTLPENLPYFDRLVVVTHPGDKATRDLCSQYSVECVVTEVMHDYGDEFNKGRAIDLGLAHLKQDAWVLHLDADIVLPHNFKRLLDHARLDTRNLYGADRLDVYGYETWMKHKDRRTPSHTRKFLVGAPDCFPLAARLLHNELGYLPIGFFQLWHGHQRYPIVQGSAEHTDVLFAAQWGREKRILLPEILCYHLQSVTRRERMGTNWNGRRTPRFGPGAGAGWEVKEPGKDGYKK